MEPRNIDHQTDGDLLVDQLVQGTHRLVDAVTILQAVETDVQPLTEVLGDQTWTDAKHRQLHAAHPQERRIHEVESRTYAEGHGLADAVEAIVLQHIQQRACFAVFLSLVRIILYDHRATRISNHNACKNTTFSSYPSKRWYFPTKHLLF